MQGMPLKAGFLKQIRFVSTFAMNPDDFFRAARRRGTPFAIFSRE
jgi:hypothetical protein